MKLEISITIERKEPFIEWDVKDIQDAVTSIIVGNDSFDGLQEFGKLDAALRLDGGEPVWKEKF